MVAQLPLVPCHSSYHLGGPRRVQPYSVDNFQETHPLLRPLPHHQRNVLLHSQTLLHPHHEHGPDHRAPQLQLPQGSLTQGTPLPLPRKVSRYHL